MVVPRKHGDTRSLLQGDRSTVDARTPFNSIGRVHFLGWSSIQKDRLSGFFGFVFVFESPLTFPSPEAL